MNSIYYILLIFIVSVSCQRKMKTDINTSKENSLIIDSLNQVSKKTKKDTYKLCFQNNDTLTVLSNLYIEDDIDSIKISKNSIFGEYYFCGKSPLNMEVLKSLKTIDNNDYNSLMQTNTAHSIIIKNDTLYISGRTKVTCLQKEEKVKIEFSIYKCYHKKKISNLLIIDNLIPKE